MDSAEPIPSLYLECVIQNNSTFKNEAPLNLIARGRLQKMPTSHQSPVAYTLRVGDENISVNPLVGQKLRIVYEHEIRCSNCQRLTKKSFNQGFCYPCFQKLASCDKCIMSPELCHYAEGTCREPEWGETHCMQPHIVYLANSTGLKVGITRGTQVPTRWMDQGAIQALPIARVSSRQLSGLIEDKLKAWATDRTNWRKMLKNDVEELNLSEARDELYENVSAYLSDLAKQFPDERIEWLVAGETYDFDYPHIAWPEKAKTYNLDKTPEIEDTLIAIKGQYLIFENAALNIRKYGSYEVSLYA